MKFSLSIFDYTFTNYNPLFNPNNCSERFVVSDTNADGEYSATTNFADIGAICSQLFPTVLKT